MKIIFVIVTLAFSYLVISLIKDAGAPKNPNISDLAPSNRIKKVETVSLEQIAKNKPAVKSRKDSDFFKYIFTEKEEQIRKKRPQRDLGAALENDNHSPWTISTSRSILQKKGNKAVDEVLSVKIKRKRSTGNHSKHKTLSSIEFLWPSDLRERQIIFEILFRCFDVINGVMTSDNKIYLMGAPPGKNHLITRSQSRHVRVKNYNQLRSERVRVENIKTLHGLSEGIMVRIFPKKLDDFIFQNVFKNTNSSADHKKEIWQYRLIGKSSIYLVSISSNGSIDRFQLPGEGSICSFER